MANSADLIDYYAKTHDARVYGTSSVKYLRYFRPEITLLHPKSIIDYGCGQSIFLDCLDLGYDVEFYRYDPAIPAYAKLRKKKVDLLVNIDVLEHVEEQDIDDVLSKVRAACRNALIVVDTKPAKHTLPDGRNAHVSLHPHGWWQERLARHFGPLETVKTKRRSRAAFRTWQRSFADTIRFYGLRAREDAVHFKKRLAGRHKEHWKVSSTGHAKPE